MIIVLRGHIRQSFKNELLYRFIKYICLHYDNVEIYIVVGPEHMNESSTLTVAV